MDGQTLLSINGKSIGVKFNRYGIEEATKIIGNISLYKNIIAQIWGGIQGYAFAKQIEPEITFEEVVDWLESIDVTNDPEGIFKKINEAYTSSQLYKTTQQVQELKTEVAAEPLTKEQAEEEAKKNIEPIPILEG